MTSTVHGGRIDPLYNVLAFHTTNDVCVNFIREWRYLQFHIDSEWQIFFLLRNFLFTLFYLLRVFARNLLREHRRRNIFLYFRFDV